VAALSYGSTYMGPIGIIMMPTFNVRPYSELPLSSTSNGSCTNVCPVKINIHDQIYAWREVMEEKNQIKFVKKEAMVVADKVLSNPHLYRIAAVARETALSALPRFALYNTLNAWVDIVSCLIR
jgi:L-lactate dehydrogenase complex protein LldF